MPAPDTLPDADLLSEYEACVRWYHMFENADVGNWSAERERRNANSERMWTLHAEAVRRRLLPPPSPTAPVFDALVRWEDAGASTSSEDYASVRRA